MTDPKTEQKGDEKPPPPTLSGAPDRELELKVKKHPEDEDAKVDLGSDELMDASDPISAAQPGSSRAGAFFEFSGTEKVRGLTFQLGREIP